jgi:gliding motility-associated-like protein
VIDTTITLIEPTPLVQDITAFTYPSGDNISCFGFNDGSIDYTISGGSPVYTFVWSNGGATEDIGSLTEGTYDVTVTDINGCVIDTTITLIEPTPLVQDITAFTYPSGDNISCFGFNDGSIDYTISGGSPVYTFVWSNGGATEDIGSLTEGTYDVTVTDINGCVIDTTITLIEPTPLVQDITAFTYPSGDNISCFGFNDGSIDYTINGGSPGYTFVWSNGGATEDIGSLTEGTYDVTVTDINGCVIDTTITLIEPTPLVQDITAFTYPSGDNISCFGFNDGSIDYTISGGSPVYTFVWSNGGATEDIGSLTEGTYDVTVTDINGCVIDTTITLIEPTPLVQDITAFTYPSGDNISCFGFNDGSIDYTISGGSPVYTFVWSNGGATEDIGSLTEGTYDVTVTDINGCVIDTTITLIEPTPLVQDITAFTYPSGDNISCFGFNDGSIDYTINGGSPGYTFVWSNGGATEDIGSLTEGTYDVTVTDINGCVIDTTITLIEPTPLVQDITAFTYPSGDNISCFGFNDGSIDYTISGGSPVYTFVWSNGGATEDIGSLTEGTYDVTVTDINGCVIDTTITLIEPTPLVQDITAFTYPSGDNISCFGFNDGSIDYTISGGSPVYTFVWSNGGATEDIGSLTEGTYDVTVTDINGCVIDTTITLIEPTPLVQDITAFTYPSGDNISCFGFNDGSIDYTISGGSPVYTFVWSNGGATEDIGSLTEGTYDVTVTDINGCVIDTTITLIEPTPLQTTTSVASDYNGQDVSCAGASDGQINVVTVDGSPVYTYEWFDNLGNLISTNVSPSGLGAGVYSVVVTDMNGCTINDQIEIIDAPDLLIDIVVSSDFNGQDISCFGSSDGSINFTPLGGTPNYTFVWTNDGGAQVSTQEDPNGLIAGSYFVTMTDANGCQADTSITLEEPTLLEALTSVITDYNGQDISCFGASDGGVEVVPTGGTPVYTYDWSNASGTSVGVTSVVNGLPTGTYEVEVTDVNGCSVLVDIFVDQPTAVTASIDILSDYFGLPISCAGQNDGEIQAIPGGGTPGYTFEWNTNPVQTTDIISNIGEGTYQVTITDVNGCQEISEVSLDGNPLPIINPDPAQGVCAGELVTFSSNSNPDDACQWIFSNGMELSDCGPNTLYIPDPGCYDATLIVTGPLGCIDSVFMDDYICIYENPIADFTANPFVGTVIENDIQFTNLSYNATSYQWEFGDGESSSEENPLHYYPSETSGEYEVLLIAYNSDGCTDSIVKTVEILKELLFYVPNTFTPDGDMYNQVFNPVFGMGVSIEDYGFFIFDRWGELIFESHDPSIGWDGTYGVGRDYSCQDGTYTWKLILKTTEDVVGGARKNVYHGHVNLIK